MFHLNKENLYRLKHGWTIYGYGRASLKEKIKRTARAMGVSQKVMYRAFRQSFNVER